MKKKLLFILILLVISLPSIAALFHSGFFQSDDGEWMIIRFSAFHQAFRDGEFPVRFLGRLNFGYGYPVANFLYPGFMYLAEVPKILGFGFVDSIKIILGASMSGSLVFTFLWLSRFFGTWESFLGGVVYLYASYHLFDIYRRGSVGEILALALFPFILWQIDRGSFFFLTVGLGILLISHNTLAVLFFLFIILYMLLDIILAKKKRKLLLNYGLKLLLGLGMSTFFWIPAIYDLKYTNFYQTSVSNFADYFAKTDLIGWSIIIIFILALIPFLLKSVKVSKHRLTLFMFIVGILSLFLATKYSLLLWNLLPVSFIQFPFRFLSLTILCASFLTAFVVSTLPKKAKILGGIIILVLLLVSAGQFLTPSQFFNKGEGFYATNEGTTTVKDEYMPKWVKKKPTAHFKEKVEVFKGQAEVKDVSYNAKEVSFSINSKNQSLVGINTLYFPGWIAKIDGKNTKIDYENEKGIMQINVSPGSHKVLAVADATGVRFANDIISLFSLFMIVILEIKNRIRPL